MKKTLMLCVLIVFFLLGIFLTTRILHSQTTRKEFLTVTDIWKNPKKYEQQIVRLRGTAFYVEFRNPLKCCLKACNCYTVTRKLDLISDPQTHNNQFSPVDLISIADLNCTGNECSLTCSTFQLGVAKVYEFVGRLVVTDRRDNIPVQMSLTDIDYSLSRQLENGAWTPIQTGTSIVTLAPEPIMSGQFSNSCEEK